MTRRALRWITAIGGAACSCIAALAHTSSVLPTNAVVSPEYAIKVAGKNAETARQQAQIFQQKRAAARQAVSNLIEEGRLAPNPEAEQPPPPSTAKSSPYARYRDPLIMGFVFALLALFVLKMLRRHKREAALRQLSGKYLIDGLEAVDLIIPDLIPAEPLPPAAIPIPELPSSAEQVSAAPGEDLAPLIDRISHLRTRVKELSPGAADADRQKVLAEISGELAWMRNEPALAPLRPLQQLSSVLEMLVKRLGEKPKDITQSSVRTVANAVDLLSELAAPGLPPDLLVAPPIRVLAVDDDPLCLRAVTFALEKASLHPDSAVSGEQAVTLAGEKSYDVILMDIQMPGIDGLQACEQIRSSPLNAETPVVFVTIQSDFHTRASSAAVGGADFIAKPFLIFEITVKTLTFATRKRLKAGRTCEQSTEETQTAYPSLALPTSETTHIPAAA